MENIVINTTSKLKHFYSLEEFRKVVYNNCISRTTVQNMANRGLIPIIKVMSRKFVPRWYVEQKIAEAINAPV